MSTQPLFNVTPYTEQRYERFLDTVDEYIADPSDDCPTGPDAFFNDLNRALTELEKFPKDQIKRIEGIRSRFIS